jgi:two-component system response regulator AlgR
MKVLIVDDEKPARDRLARMLGLMDGCEIVGEAGNGKEALEKAETLGPDIVLMDIRMPGMDGIQAARHLSRLSRPPAVVFTTAFADHALEAFETHAVDYLLKPVRKERLAGALEAAGKPNRAQSIANEEVFAELEARQHICARVRGNLVLIQVEDIFYFQADQKYVTVRHSDGEVLIEDPLKTLELEFTDKFCRIHRNALVNLDKICGMKSENDSQRVIFKEIEETLEVSRRHLPSIRKIIKNL